MKMRNDDIKKITETKQYLLDPPASFKLYTYAPDYLRNAIDVLDKYPEAQNLIVYLQGLANQFDKKAIAQSDLRKTLKEAAVEISKITRN